METSRWTFCGLLTVLGLLYTATGVAGNTTYDYDALGRLTSVAYDNGQSITYAYDAAGNRTQVVATAPPLPTGTFTANPTSVVTGGATTLSWSSTNATSASIGGLGAVSPASGSVSVTPPTTTTYTLTLTGAGGSITKNVAVIVTDPAAPTGSLGASPTSIYWGGSSTLTWSSANATSASISSVGIIAPVSGGSVTVSPTTTTTYTLTLSGAGGTVTTNATVTVTDGTAPTAPTGLNAVAVGQTRIDLSWSGSTDAGGSGLAAYRIYRNGSLLTATTTTLYSDNTVAAGTTYSYSVVAYDNAQNVSAPSNTATATTETPDTAAPSAPSGVLASIGGDNLVNLSWNASSDSGGSGLAGYHIYRAGTLIGSTDSNVRSFADTGVVPFNTYSYTVTAYDGASNVSTASAVASVTLAYPITNGSGVLLATAASKYASQSGCSPSGPGGPLICNLIVRRLPSTVVMAAAGVSTSPCYAPLQTISAGYQRSGCVVTASPSAYGP